MSKSLVPLEPDDSVFVHDHRLFAIMRKVSKEYEVASVVRQDGYCFKVVDDFRYFPEHLIEGKREQDGIPKARELNGYARKP